MAKPYNGAAGLIALQESQLDSCAPKLVAERIYKRVPNNRFYRRMAAKIQRSNKGQYD